LKKTEAKQLKHRLRYQSKTQPKASLWLKVEKFQRQGSDTTFLRNSFSKIKIQKQKKNSAELQDLCGAALLPALNHKFHKRLVAYPKAMVSYPMPTERQLPRYCLPKGGKVNVKSLYCVTELSPRSLLSHRHP
jgi:hypothetical protein